jgi:hypothetical protein
MRTAELKLYLAFVWAKKTKTQISARTGLVSFIKDTDPTLFICDQFKNGPTIHIRQFKS